MTNHKNTKKVWPSFIIYFSTTFVVTTVCSFCAYIPLLRTLSGEPYDQFLADRIRWALFSSATFPSFFTLIAVLIASARHKVRPLNNSRLFLCSLGPYITYCILFGYLFFSQQHIDLDSVKPFVSPYDPSERIFSEMEIALVKLSYQGDLNYYLYAISIGFLLLILYTGYRKHFFVMVQSSTNTPTSNRRENTNSIDSNKELLHEAEKLANTFAKPIAKDTPKTAVNFEMYAFIYGEGFDYVIINGGHTIPMVFDDNEGPATILNGIYLHINNLLYIRCDHVMLIDVKKKIVVISPLLQAIFDRINKESVKKKLFSYQVPGQSKGHYAIAPQLIPEIKKKLKME